MDTANRNTAQENELARNHPATNAGIFLGNILGNWGGWRAGQMFQKYLEGKQQPDFKVPPINYTNSATGETFSRSDVQKMLANGKASIRTENIPNYNFFADTQQSQVNPMSQGAINRFAEKMTGSTIQQKASQAMGGYTPPQDYNFDLNDYTNLTPQNYNSAQNWKNDLISKHSLQPLQNYLTQQNSTPQTSTSTQFNFNPNNFNFRVCW